MTTAFLFFYFCAYFKTENSNYKKVCDKIIENALILTRVNIMVIVNYF